MAPDGGVLKFFTQEWHRGEMADADAERVPSLYEAYLGSLGPGLPDDARRLWTEVSLHDALVRSVERADHRLVVLYRAGDNSSGYVDARLTYDDVSLIPTDEEFLRNAIGRRDVEVLYDEFDSANERWVHRLLFWPYREVSIGFGGFGLAVTLARVRHDDDPADANA